MEVVGKDVRITVIGCASGGECVVMVNEVLERTASKTASSSVNPQSSHNSRRCPKSNSTTSEHHIHS